MEYLSYTTKMKLKSIKIPEHRIINLEKTIRTLTDVGLIIPTCDNISYKQAEKLIGLFKTNSELRSEGVLNVLK